MKTTRFMGLLGIVSAALALAVPAVQAIPLTFAVSGVGQYAPASSYNNDTDATFAINAMVGWYNGGVNPSGGGVTFTLVPGSGLPPPALPLPIVFGFKDEESPFVGIDSNVYAYILGKYGNVAYVFYLGNLAPGLYTIPATLGGHDLSHEIAFTAQHTTSVPDGGATIALLGVGLLGLGLLQRRLKLA